jgi:ADP-ribose pyrophosphatase YjhB (NUDIX family)
MQLFFLHNIPIRVLHHLDLLNMGLTYDFISFYRPSLLATSLHTGDLLIQTESSQLKVLLNEISQISHKKPRSITILITDREDISVLLQQHFKLTKAAGGIVIKGNQILMIYRGNTWDLPKGRIEEGESALSAAVREVQEECGVKAGVKAEFYPTWHAFQSNNNHILKQTTWYIMECIDDTYMAPQKEEAIEQVAWIRLTQLQPILQNTYTSIRLLIQAYQNHHNFKKT